MSRRAAPKAIGAPRGQERSDWGAPMSRRAAPKAIGAPRGQERSDWGAPS